MGTLNRQICFLTIAKIVYILDTFEKVKLRSAKRFVIATRNLKIKIPSVYKKIRIYKMIEAIGLSKNYGLTQALSNVNFSIPNQQIVGLLGPNGAGKTTLMKILTGYMEPGEGLAQIDGENVIDNPQSVQKKIGYLPENAPVYRDMLVQEYLQMIAELREIPENEQLQLISDAVISTGLEEYLIRPIGQLSKGYRQRVGLAQAILHKPKVLILDEPTSGLDPNQIVEIRHLIQELAKNATILLSTHILSEVELTCERVLIIMKGELQTDASLSELKAVNAAILSVENKADNVEQALKKIKGVSKIAAVDDYSNNHGFKTYNIQGELDNLCPAIHQVVKQQGWNIAELRPHRKTLETVFSGLASHSGGEA